MRYLSILLLALPTFGSAQEIQPGLSYRDIESDNYFRVNYENDLAFYTDHYYTQGVHFEIVSSVFNGSLLRKLFPFSSDSSAWNPQYGVGLESAGYTPTSITADSVLRGDRPFAGMAYAKLFSVAINFGTRTRISSIWSLGWMGPAAGGYEIQSYIHRQTGNADPAGWKYQVGNSPVINYEVNYERSLRMPVDWCVVSLWGMARAGTLSTKAGLGAIVTVGFFNDPYIAWNCFIHDFRAYFYVHPEADFVGYDATLQGGPFTRDNPYTIPAADVSRVTFRTRAGAVLAYDRFTLGISMRYLTKEFRTGQEHLTGGVSLAVGWW